MPEDEPEEFDDDEGPDKIKNILWYLTLVIGLTLVILYWGLFINLDMLLISLQPWVPKVAVALLTLFVANLFIKLTKPVLKNAYYRRRGKVEEWKVVSMVYSYIIWTFTVLILLAGVFGRCGTRFRAAAAHPLLFRLVFDNVKAALHHWRSDCAPKRKADGGC
jgi:hypothetical protein